MNRTTLLLTFLLSVVSFPSLGVDVKDLVKRDGLFYEKFTDVPYTGKVTGEEQGSLRNGKREGEWVIYHDYGGQWSRGTYKNGKEEGAWVRYHKNGQLRRKEFYKNGYGHGEWAGYYENGQLESKGTMNDGNSEGYWEFYDEDGTINKDLTGIYKNSRKISD